MIFSLNPQRQSDLQLGSANRRACKSRGFQFLIFQDVIVRTEIRADTAENELFEVATMSKGASTVRLRKAGLAPRSDYRRLSGKAALAAARFPFL